MLVCEFETYAVQLGVGGMEKLYLDFFLNHFTILSQFFVMLVLLFCNLSEHYSQTNFPIVTFKVTKNNNDRYLGQSRRR